MDSLKGFCPRGKNREQVSVAHPKVFCSKLYICDLKLLFICVEATNSVLPCSRLIIYKKRNSAQSWAEGPLQTYHGSLGLEATTV